MFGSATIIRQLSVNRLVWYVVPYGGKIAQGVAVNMRCHSHFIWWHLGDSVMFMFTFRKHQLLSVICFYCGGVGIYRLFELMQLLISELWSVDVKMAFAWLHHGMDKHRVQCILVLLFVPFMPPAISLQKHLGYFNHIFGLPQLHLCNQGMLPNRFSWKFIDELLL